MDGSVIAFSEKTLSKIHGIYADEVLQLNRWMEIFEWTTVTSTHRTPHTHKIMDFQQLCCVCIRVSFNILLEIIRYIYCHFCFNNNLDSAARANTHMLCRGVESAPALFVKIYLITLPNCILFYCFYLHISTSAARYPFHAVH